MRRVLEGLSPEELATVRRAMDLLASGAARLLDEERGELDGARRTPAGRQPQELAS